MAHESKDSDTHLEGKQRMCYACYAVTLFLSKNFLLRGQKPMLLSNCTINTRKRGPIANKVNIQQNTM